MDIELNYDISLMDELKIVLVYLLPILRTLRRELGEERANQIVQNSLREGVRNHFQQLATRFPGSPLDKWRALNALSAPRIGNDVEFQNIKNDPDEMVFNVTGCAFADLLQQIGEPELGKAILCDADHSIAEVGSPLVELYRTQTIMEGAEYCDFHYKIDKGEKQH